MPTSWRRGIPRLNTQDDLAAGGEPEPQDLLGQARQKLPFALIMIGFPALGCGTLDCSDPFPLGFWITRM